MILEFMGSVPAQAGLWPPLNQLIDEISSLYGPAFRYLGFFDDGLFGHDLFLDGSAVSAYIGSLAHHQFIDDDPQGIVVDFVAVVLLGHDLRSHVAGSSTGVGGILFSVLLCDTEVSKMKITCVSTHVPLASNTMFSGLMSRWIIF